MREITTPPTSKLGAYKATFLPKKNVITIGRYGMVIMLSFAALMGYQFVQKWFAEPSKILSDSFRQDQLLVNGIMCVIFILFAIGFYFLSYIQQKVRGYIFEGGFVFKRWRCDVATHWKDIKAVYRIPVYAGKNRRIVNWYCKVELHSGRVLNLRGFAAPHILGIMLENDLVKHTAHHAWMAFEVGETLQFGPKLSLSSEGVLQGEETIPWNSIKDIQINPISGTFTMQQIGKRQNWNIIPHKLGNPMLLNATLALLRKAGYFGSIPNEYLAKPAIV